MPTDQTEVTNATLPGSSGIVPIPDPTTLTNQLVTRAVSAVREVLETQISEINNRVNRMEPTLFDRLTASMEQLKELHGEKFKALAISIDTNTKNTDEAQTSIQRFYDEKFRSPDTQTAKAAFDVRSAMEAAFVAAGDAQQKQEAAFTKQIEATDLATRQFYDEKFRSLDAQTTKAAADVRSAMEAAFVAAAGASQKQEAAFTKQIDQLTVNVQLISKVTDDKLADLKDRIVAMEGRTSISDPNTAAALRDMTMAIAALKTSSDTGAGGTQQRTESSTWILGVVGALVAVGVLVLAVIEKLGH
jgi:hypothetical protein